MSLRDLVTGSDVCAPSDVGGPSNAVGTLTNALLGTSKVQDGVLELPNALEGPSHQGNVNEEVSLAQVTHNAVHGELPSIPGFSHHPKVPSPYNKQLGAEAGPTALYREFDEIYNQQLIRPQAGPSAHHEVIIEEAFKTFMRCAESGLPYTPTPLPPIFLPVNDQCQIRDRAMVMARQLFADKGPAFAHEQAFHFLMSLGIHPSQLPRSHDVPPPEWSNIWNSGPETQQQMETAWQDSQHKSFQAGPHEGWATEFSQANDATNWSAEFAKASISGPDVWANEFEKRTEGWAADFEKETEAQEKAETDVGPSEGAKNMNAQDISRALIDQMSNDPDPKFRNSKFLKFVSKMSRGELVVIGNEAIEVVPAENSWANEFEQAANKEAPHQDWAKEFAQIDSQLGASTSEQWIKEFGSLEGGWLQDSEVEEWVNAYTQNTTGQAANHEYVFSKTNPFEGDSQAFLKGCQFFSKGVLTEAALAVEAEVQQNPENAEAWRLLGVIHAENDDDVQAIAAFQRARELEPNNMEVLLSLGVSYANELDREGVENCMTAWLMNHPDHMEVAKRAQPPPDPSQKLVHLIGIFHEAAAVHPQDPDLHSSMGVLHHLAQDYDSAVISFEKALDKQADNYSLWNKLGATLANSGRSSAAVRAYQKALDIKPNYMRGWTNLGISYANLGEYMDSLKYYARALTLNPKADGVWGYLRTSLLCAGHTHLLELVDSKDVDGIVSRLGLASSN